MKMHFLTRKCSVPECGNMSTMGDGCFKTYFEFPSDKTLREKWFEAILMKHPEGPLKEYKICDDHFGPEAKFTTNNSWRRLRLGSVPTLKLPKFVCKTCLKTVDKRKEANKENLCQCVNPKPSEFPPRDEKKKEHSKQSRSSSSSSKEKRKESDNNSKRSMDRSNEKNRKREDSSTSSRNVRSTSPILWTLDEKEALLSCIQKYGRIKAFNCGRLTIEWSDVTSKYREMGYTRSERELRNVWQKMRDRARKVQEFDRGQSINKLDRKMSRFLYGRKFGWDQSKLSRDTSPEVNQKTSKPGTSKKSSSSSKRKKDYGSSDDEAHAAEKKKKEEYATYQIVNSKKNKSKMETDSKKRNKDKKERSKVKKRRRIIETSDSESEKDNVEEDRSSGFDEMETDRETSEVDERAVNVKNECLSSDGEEYVTKDDIEAFYDRETVKNYDTSDDMEEQIEPEIKSEEVEVEQKYGIWEVKGVQKQELDDEDLTSDKSDKEDDSGDEYWGLEDLKRLGYNIDDILKPNQNVKRLVYPEHDSSEPSEVASCYSVVSSDISRNSSTNTDSELLEDQDCEKLDSTSTEVSEAIDHEKNDKFCCEYCRVQLENKRNYLQHISKHLLDADVYLCEQCGKTFARKRYLQKHLKNVKHTKCRYCDEILPSSALKRHVESEH